VKILILKPSSLGDVVQALPVLRLLRRKFPQSEIHWWIDHALLPLLQDDPDLTAAIPFDRRAVRTPRGWGGLGRSLRMLRAARFDWVIDLQGLARSGVVAWLARGGLSIGVNTGRECARGFYDRCVDRPASCAHAVDWYLALLRALEVPVHGDFEWLPQRPVPAAAFAAKWPHDGNRWVAIVPGARWENKRWPVEHFSETTRRLLGHDPRMRMAILGSGDDAARGAVLAGIEPRRCLDLTGQTTLPEMIEWVRRSELVISNDTGTMHVAAALRKPVVALFGPTDPAQTGPYGQQQEALHIGLPCAPCMKDRCGYERPLECLRGISPDRVAAEALRRLGHAV
jgi:lipopolysaccharide heptosyltransferase II